MNMDKVTTYEQLEQKYRRWCLAHKKPEPRAFFVEVLTLEYPFLFETYGGGYANQEPIDDATLALTEWAEKNGIPFDPVMFVTMYRGIVEENGSWYMSEICY